MPQFGGEKRGFLSFVAFLYTWEVDRGIGSTLVPGCLPLGDVPRAAEARQKKRALFGGIISGSERRFIENG